MVITILLCLATVHKDSTKHKLHVRIHFSHTDDHWMSGEAPLGGLEIPGYGASQDSKWEQSWGSFSGWLIVHLWQKSPSPKKNSIVSVCIHRNWGSFNSTSAPYLQVMKLRLQRLILPEAQRYLSFGGLFTFFSPSADRNINGDPTFSAAVIPVIKTCWQLKVKFIVTLGPGLRRHIKNWLCMPSWPWKETRETRSDQRAAQ